MTQSLWHGKTLGFLGGGNMAEAIVRGVLAAGVLPAGAITVHDPLPARRDVFAALGCVPAATPQEAAGADVLLLAVKPQKIDEALRAVALGADALLVSIAAGVPAAKLENLLRRAAEQPRVVRVMPNTPLLVGRGTSALAKGANATAEDMALAMTLFAGCGTAVEVDEDRLDAVTALSGSGPAYLFRFAEALQRAGESLGLDAGLAGELTVSMLRGSAEMLCRLGNPAKLREQVTSPGGTTAAALRVFEEAHFEETVARALAAARDRSVELGKNA